MSAVLDEGLALFAGLNVIPKRAFLTEYSCRIDPACYPKLMHRWFDAVSRLGLPRGESFDLDFHTIPFHGEDALMEKHYPFSCINYFRELTERLRSQGSNELFLCILNATTDGFQKHQCNGVSYR